MSVHLRIENHVATVTLARPDVLNAVDLATEAALQRIWTEIEGRDDVRVVVLTGEGERAFCVGADLKNPTTTGLEYWGAARRRHRAARDPERAGRGPRQRFRAGRRLRDGAGLRHRGGLRGSQLRPAGGAGGRMPLDGGMTLLQRQIPYRKAMAMLLTVAESRARGGRARPDQRSGAPRRPGRSGAAVGRRPAGLRPLSQQAIKQVVRRTGTLSPADAQALRLPALVAALQSEDAHEGVLAFQQKRKPQWRGR